ncbi:MAG TPA: anthranilate phosphoribosyltransferase [Propionicimonas sp.]|nr:anthranilate phosphoribosyltransferase [Propionicimonas sp.]HRA07023.1 anthranilate phosphoribosyltransferase [Propionicimonas sp.]
MTFTWPGVLSDLINRVDLTPDAAAWAMDQVLSGDTTAVQVAGFAVALRAKGETAAEITGLASAMLARSTPIRLNTEAVDVVGSGGDRANTVNVSTMAAIVTAACGVPVVKHGNRAASSACGTADCLEALGLAIDVPPAAQAEVLAKAGIVFLFAPLYHPSLRFAASARRELGVQTTFNFLGPLANPARPVAQAVGVADARMAPLMAQVFAGRGQRGLVFHGADGLDELTTTTTSDVWLVQGGEVAQTSLDPSELGVIPATRDDLVGGTSEHNAGVVRDLLAGTPGPVRDIVALNAAAAQLAFAGPDMAAPLAGQLAEPLRRAYAAIDSGAAARTLDTWVQVTRAARAS